MSISTEVTRGAGIPPGIAAHEHRRLVERQIRFEFAAELDHVAITDLVTRALVRFDDAPIRTFVPILALRHARFLARSEIAVRATPAVGQRLGDRPASRTA